MITDKQKALEFMVDVMGIDSVNIDWQYDHYNSASLVMLIEAAGLLEEFTAFAGNQI